MVSQRSLSLSYVAFGLVLLGSGIAAFLMAEGLLDLPIAQLPEGIFRPALVALPFLGLAFLCQGLADLLPAGGRVFAALGPLLGGLWLFLTLAGAAWMLTWASFGPGGQVREVELLGIPFTLLEPARSLIGRVLLGAVALLLDLLLAAFVTVFAATRLESLGKSLRRRRA